MPEAVYIQISIIAALLATVASSIAAAIWRARRRTETALRERLAVLEMANRWLEGEVKEPKEAEQSSQRIRDGLEQQAQERSRVPVEMTKGLQNEIRDREWMQQSLQDAREQLEQRMAEIRALASELTRREHRERDYLAHALHDQMQQILGAARLRVRLLKRDMQDEPATQPLDEIDQLLDDALAECRSLTLELAPPLLQEAGLAGMLEWLAKESEKRHGLTVEFRGTVASDDMHKTTRTFLFHAIRELLYNSIKHSRADRVWIAIARTEDDMLRVEVGDQGVGCDPGRLVIRPGGEGGFGLFSIRERVELLGGQMDIVTAPGKGMQVVIEVPTAPEPPAPPGTVQANKPASLRRQPSSGPPPPSLRKPRKSSQPG